MPQPDDIVDEDIIVREFSGRFLIFRFHAPATGLVATPRQGLGESDDRNQAIAKAFDLAGKGHAVWFCDARERYQQVS